MSVYFRTRKLWLPFIIFNHLRLFANDDATSGIWDVDFSHELSSPLYGYFQSVNFTVLIYVHKIKIYWWGIMPHHHLLT